MSLTEDPSCENNQKEMEDEELDPEDFNGKDVPEKDLLEPSQTEKRMISPLMLLKEDFSQFKQELMKVFKDKETNLRTSQSAEKLISPLTLLKEDISSVFRSGLSKERDDKDVTVKEASCRTSRKKTTNTERAAESLKSLFRKDRNLLKTSHTAKDRKEVKKSGERTEDKRNNQVDESEDNQLDINVSEDKNEMKNSFTQIEQADHKRETEDWSDDSSAEEEPSETHPHETHQSSGITLFSLRNGNEVNLGDQPADLWSVKQFACYLTFDPNTANSELCLSEGNRRVTRVWQDHRPSGHPERFSHCPQVLCREGLLDLVYWEVVWTGGADIGVTYNNISRDGDVESCLLGHNKCSWSLECSEGCYTPCHNRKRFKSSSPEPFTHRVGVYLNWPAGSLSFYCISPDTMVHLHTFTSTFTEPLYPGFWVWGYNGSVSLCQVELDWERLLQ